jgi:hypothetical protein
LAAISAPAALAGDDSGPAVDAAGSTSPTTPPTSGEPPASSEPEPVDPGPAEPVTTESAAPQLDPVEPTPTDPGTGSVPTEPAPPSSGTEPAPLQAAPSGGSTEAGPTAPRPTNPGPVDPSPGEPMRGDRVSREEAPAPGVLTSHAETESPSHPEDEAASRMPDDDADNGAEEPTLNQQASAGESQEAVAIAGNRNLVFQVVWQVQEGCRTFCYWTSQSQSVIQWSSTTQTAKAVAGGRETRASSSSPAAAEAYNESITVQFVWQLQIGCVAFCYETSQIQSASQWAETIQTAIAEADLKAWAENLSETLQFVWQIQEGCAHECYGVHKSQTILQQQSTSQLAAATAGHEGAATMIILGPDGLVVLPGWLLALAANHGATIQTIYQRQQAICLEHCQSNVQLQEAIQQALTSQQGIAIAWVGAREVEPSLEQASGQVSPLDQLQAEQPPAQQSSENAPVERSWLEQPVAPAAQPAHRALTVSALAPLPRRPSARAPSTSRTPSRRSRWSGALDASAEQGSRLKAPALPPAGGGQLPPSPGMPTSGTASLATTSFPSADGPSAATPPAHVVQAFAPFALDLTLERTTLDDSVHSVAEALVVAALALLGALAALRLARANPRSGAR